MRSSRQCASYPFQSKAASTRRSLTRKPMAERLYGEIVALT